MNKSRTQVSFWNEIKNIGTTKLYLIYISVLLFFSFFIVRNDFKEVVKIYLAALLVTLIANRFLPYAFSLELSKINLSSAKHYVSYFRNMMRFFFLLGVITLFIDLRMISGVAVDNNPSAINSIGILAFSPVFFLICSGINNLINEIKASYYASSCKK